MSADVKYSFNSALLGDFIRLLSTASGPGGLSRDNVYRRVRAEVEAHPQAASISLQISRMELGALKLAILDAWDRPVDQAAAVTGETRAWLRRVAVHLGLWGKHIEPLLRKQEDDSKAISEIIELDDEAGLDDVVPDDGTPS